MTLANNTVLVTPGSGATLATQSPGSGTTEYHVMIPASASGHLTETEPTYTLQLPPLDSAANRYHFEFFNGSGSTFTIEVREVYPMTSSDTATTNNLSMRFDLFRTTAFSSGGTAHTNESSSTFSANFSRFDTTDRSLPSGISCKTVLTSITTGAWLGPRYATTAISATARWEATLANRVNWANLEAVDDAGIEFLSSKRLILRPGEGIAARQGTVASTMSFLWFLQFVMI